MQQFSRKFLGTVVVGILAISSLTAQVTPLDGDVFLGIRNTTAASSYVLDLGSMDLFIKAFNSKSNLTFGSINTTSLYSDLNAVLGLGWYTNTKVKFGLFGGFQAGSSDSSIINMPDNALIMGNPTNTVLGNLPDGIISALTGYANNIN